MEPTKLAGFIIILKSVGILAINKNLGEYKSLGLGCCVELLSLIITLKTVDKLFFCVKCG